MNVRCIGCDKDMNDEIMVKSLDDLVNMFKQGYRLETLPEY